MTATTRDAEAAADEAFEYSAFSFERDAYSPISYPLRPLPFDRVSDGSPITSNCPIFKLPFELHPDILCHLNEYDLANMALVDKDCRLLARSAQFATMRLSVFQPSLDMLTQIFNESTGNEDEVPTSARGLGKCVHRLIFIPGVFTVVETPRNEVARRVNVLLSLLTACVHVAFPNLRLFQFADYNPVPLALFQGLARVPLQHLSFDAFLVESGQETEEETVFSMCRWPGLRSLSTIRRPSTIRSRAYVNASDRAVFSILKNVAPSLESLRLSGVDAYEYLPEFSRLRRLHLERYWKKPNDGSDILRSLFPLGGSATNSLESLQLERIDAEHLIRIGRMPRLRKLVINDPDLRDNFAFLAANPQLEFLSFTFPIKADTLQTAFLPINPTSSFRCLRVLRLTSAASHFPESAILAIGLISSLEMLWISAGRRMGRWQYQLDWFIDHKTIQEGLKGLKQLRELAFTHDNYDVGIQEGLFANNRLYYYSNQDLPLGVSEHDVLTSEDEEYLRSMQSEKEADNASRRKRYVWEKWHREKMRKLGEEYADLFPHLAFLYAGQYPMKVVHDSNTKTREIHFLTRRRDDYVAELNRKWDDQTI